MYIYVIYSLFNINLGKHRQMRKHGQIKISVSIQFIFRYMESAEVIGICYKVHMLIKVNNYVDLIFIFQSAQNQQDMQILERSQSMFYKLLGLTLLAFVNCGTVLDNRPDALACTQGFVRSRTDTTLYFWHTGLMYCQVYALQDRCIIFHPNETFRIGYGHYLSRKGCQGKSLSQLRSQNRWFNFADGDMIPSIQSNINSLGTSYLTLQGDNINLKTRISILEGSSMVNFRQNVSYLESSQNTQDNKITSLETNISTLLTNISALASSLLEQRTKLESVETAQNNFQKQAQIWRNICIVIIALQFVAIVILCIMLYKKRSKI